MLVVQAFKPCPLALAPLLPYFYHSTTASSCCGQNILTHKKPQKVPIAPHLPPKLSQFFCYHTFLRVFTATNKRQQKQNIIIDVFRVCAEVVRVTIIPYIDRRFFTPPPRPCPRPFDAVFFLPTPSAVPISRHGGSNNSLSLWQGSTRTGWSCRASPRSTESEASLLL